MSLPDDLLEQADHLARRDPTRPKQASLRRAISTAYYALFHFLVSESTFFLVTDSKMRQLVPRAFDHKEMKDACKPFAAGTLPEHLKAIAASVVPNDLKRVAAAFVQLQQARHEADYNLARSFNRQDTLDYLQLAQAAFESWRLVSDQQIAGVFLVHLLLGTKWKR